MRLRDDFVWNLAKEEIQSWDVTVSRAKLLGFNVNLPYVCILGLHENVEAVFQIDNTEQMPYEYWLQNMVRHIEEIILYSGKMLQKKVMTTYQQNALIIYLEVPDYQMNNTFHKFLDLKKQNQRVVPSIDHVLGYRRKSCRYWNLS